MKKKVNKKKVEYSLKDASVKDILRDMQLRIRKNNAEFNKKKFKKKYWSFRLKLHRIKMGIKKSFRGTSYYKVENSKLEKQIDLQYKIMHDYDNDRKNIKERLDDIYNIVANLDGRTINRIKIKPNEETDISINLKDYLLDEINDIKHNYLKTQSKKYEDSYISRKL